MVRIIAICAVLFLGLAPYGSVLAATVNCSQQEGNLPYWEEDEVKDHSLPTDRRYCRVAVLSGPIIPEDVQRIKELLRREPFIRRLYVYSNGGSVDAAIQVGRIIKARLMIVSSGNHEIAARQADCKSADYARTQIAKGKIEGEDDGLTRPELGPLSDEDVPEWNKRKAEERLADAAKLRVKKASINDAEVREWQGLCHSARDCRVGNRCCLSACGLLLAASFDWHPNSIGNIGLHRPSLTDAATADYDSSTKRLQTVGTRMRDYLAEMEVSPTLLDAMMKVPPDQILLLDGKAASALIVGASNNKVAHEEYAMRPGAYLRPSAYDWALARCPKKDDRCVSEMLFDEFLRKAREIRQ